MAYTPELSQKSSCTLRRIAWALGVPMTKAIEMVFDHIPEIVDKRSYTIDSAKAFRMLNFQPERLREGLEEMKPLKV